MNKQNFKNQTDEVLWILTHYKSVKSIDFIVKFGIIRYPVAIFNLRHGNTADGNRYIIDMKDKMVKIGKRLQRQTSYSLRR